MAGHRIWLLPTRLMTRRGIALGLLLVGVLLVLWLIASCAIAYRLTLRPRPPFREPIPSVGWGTFESHRLKTRDGHEIGAWFVPGQEGAPSVLLLHGVGASRSACLGRAEVFAAQGCAVLMISLRAHGDSTGEFNDFGWSARHDVIAAVAFLEQRHPGRPIVVHGLSMGAAAAVFASGELAHRVHGYILESPYQDLMTAVRHRTENALPPVLDEIASLGLRIVAPLVLPDWEKIAPVAAIEGIPTHVPVLILAGGQDPVARPDEARALYARVRSHGKLILFKRAGHMNFPENDPELYSNEVLDFVRSVHPVRRPMIIRGGARSEARTSSGASAVVLRSVPDPSLSR